MATHETPHEAPTHFRDSRGNMIVDAEHHPEALEQGYAAAHDAIQRQTTHANPYTPNTGRHEAWMAGHQERMKREESGERTWSEATDALETARLRLQAIRDHVNAFEQYAKAGDATWARNRVVMAAAELNCIADDLEPFVDNKTQFERDRDEAHAKALEHVDRMPNPSNDERREAYLAKWHETFEQIQRDRNERGEDLAQVMAQADANTKPYVAALRITIPVRAKDEEDAAQLAADLITFDDSVVNKAEFMDIDAFPA